MQEETKKMLKEIFKDFEINSNIINTKIDSINLYKKSNKFEINILADDTVKVKDIGYFERYLKKRFSLSETVIHIKYKNDLKIDFQEQWNDILDYLAYKHPLTKALLEESKIKVEGNIVNICLKLMGSDILYGRGMDVILSDLIFNSCGIRYKIKYLDNNQQEYLKEVKEFTNNLEKEAIKKVKARTTINEVKKENEEETKVQEVKVQEKQSTENSNSNKKEAEEISPLILGRNQNIKEPLVKVIDISVDSGKICLEGEIINTDSRELKSGKYLFMFDLYDGTSTITCKAFIESEKFKEVSRKNKVS